MSEEKIPKVSVCVVTYNQEKYIRRCLQSIVDQETDFDFEVIVGDDCSTDGTRAIVQEFADKYLNMVKPIFHENNIGAYKNEKFIHYLAIGEYIAHCDGDDYWHPDKLQYQINFMENNQSCAAVYTNAWVETDLGEIVGVFSSGVKKNFDISYLIQKGNFLTYSSTMYRTKFRELVIPDSGGFVDFLVHIRLAECGQLGFIDKCLVSYTYRSATSIIVNNNTEIRLLIWDALQNVNLPNEEAQVIDNAKLYFIADAIIFETLHGSCQNIAKWVSLLSNNLKIGIFMVNLKLAFFVLTILSNKTLNRFRRFISKGNKNGAVFYK